MRSTMKCLCKVVIFSVFLPLSCQVAQGSWSPLGVGLFFTDETQSPGIDDSVYGLNIGVFGSRLDEMKGLSVSSLATIADDMTGIVFSGIFNKTESAADGVWQVGGGGNEIEDSGAGLQIAGLFNYAKDFTGTQVAYINYGAEYFHGVQIGFANISEKMTGIQIGIFNEGMPDGEMDGIQIGICNEIGLGGVDPIRKEPMRHKTVNGFQIGVINAAENMGGVQIGAINIANKADAVQIGALNIAKDSFSGIQIGVLNISGGGDFVVLPLLRVSF